MRKLKGTVVSDKMLKTRVVAVERLTKHPRYHKYYTVTSRFKAHDEANEYKTGDAVIIQEGRPLSKTKRWTIIGRIAATK
jgi:small subunit ribosomal protein S17